MSARSSRFDSFAIPLAFAALKLVLQAIALPHWGYFRDELYYLECARHLAWGYVDHPPLSIALLALVRATLGDSLWAIRSLPALAGAATVVVTGLIARELGGGRFAQALACLAAVLVPIWLGVDHFFSMNAIDTLLWTLAAWTLLRALERHDVRTWAAFGVVVGLGLLNKTSMAWFAGGAALGVLATPHRRVLASRGPWLAVAIAALLFAPHVAWQVANGWPTLEFVRNATQHKMVHTGFVEFWRQQLSVMGPGNALLWLLGLFALARDPRGRPLAITFVAVAALLVASGSSRPNYLAVAYAPLLAAGAVAVASASAARGRAWLRPVAIAWVLLLGAVAVPVALPLGSVEQWLAYTRAIGFHAKAQEHSAESDLPQGLADMFGWEDMVARVARVYHALPDSDRVRCAIFANNYGEAGAIDRFGPRLGLPHAISRHNNYWLWGPRQYSGDVVIIVGGDRDDAHADFRSVVLADTTSCAHAMPYENGAPIWVCRGLDQPLARRWREIRTYD